MWMGNYYCKWSIDLVSSLVLSSASLRARCYLCARNESKTRRSARLLPGQHHSIGVLGIRGKHAAATSSKSCSMYTDTCNNQLYTVQSGSSSRLRRRRKLTIRTAVGLICFCCHVRASHASQSRLRLLMLTACIHVTNRHGPFTPLTNRLLAIVARYGCSDTADQRWKWVIFLDPWPMNHGQYPYAWVMGQGGVWHGGLSVLRAKNRRLQLSPCTAMIKKPLHISYTEVIKTAKKWVFRWRLKSLHNP